MISDKVDFASEDFLMLCKTHQIKELYAFGSVVDGNFTDESDIDLLVEIGEPDPVLRGKLILNLYTELGNLFSKKIDLLTNESIRNPVLEDVIGSTKTLIYPIF